MKVIFSHGKESGPWGSKIKALSDKALELGFETDSIDFRDTMDPDVRVVRLVEAAQGFDDYLLVGSSMGGYVSLVAAEVLSPQGVFLLAPALYIEGYRQDYPTLANTPLEIVHGWGDDVIPYQNSVKFAEQADCSLHLIKGDHRLNSSLDEVMSLFERFLASVKK